MGRYNNATGTNWAGRSGGDILASVYPRTMDCWYWPNGTTSSNLFVCGNTAGDGYLTLGADSTGAWANRNQNGGSDPLVHSTKALKVGQWNHLCAVFASATSMTIYLDGGSSASNATSITPASISLTQLFVYRPGSTSFSPADGIIADANVWGAALPAGEVVRRARGVPGRLVQPGDLVASWLPRDDAGVFSLQDVNPYRPRRYDLTVNGTLRLDLNPPVAAPAEPKRRYWRGRGAGRPANTATSWLLTA